MPTQPSYRFGDEANISFIPAPGGQYNWSFNNCVTGLPGDLEFIDTDPPRITGEVSQGAVAGTYRCRVSAAGQGRFGEKTFEIVITAPQAGNPLTVTPDQILATGIRCRTTEVCRVEVGTVSGGTPNYFLPSGADDPEVFLPDDFNATIVSNQRIVVDQRRVLVPGRYDFTLKVIDQATPPNSARIQFTINVAQ